ncbi:MAG: transcriptional regulator, partial [Eubacteriales bacterium]|nr:transcriptional regulator [Eubacteriales bacterium]
MANIQQTNRTILMEEINPEKLDLITLVGDTKGIDSLSDEKIKEINENLLVRNFSEFLEKFEPVVYSFFNANTQKVMYTLKKPESIPEEMLTEIHLNESNDFLKMLMTLIDAKKAQGIINVDFKFENLTDLISPKKVMDDIRQNRKELQYVYGEYVALEDGDPKKLDIADKLNVMFEEASTNYNNVMAMLPLAIEDIKTRLLLGGGEEESKTPLALGVLSMGEDGELKILEAPKSETTAIATIDDNVNQGLIQALEEDYEAINEDSNDYVKALVSRTFCPLVSTMVTDIDVSKEINNYNSYLEFYKTAKDDFIKIAKPLIEKILGVWAFFEQYPKKLKGMKPSLLITNTTNEMVVKSNNIPRIITYLNTVNAKNDFKNTVWYGIIPNVSLDQNSKMKLTRERFKGNEVKEKIDVNSVESLGRILDIFKDYGIQGFFSYETGDKTTFDYMATEG